jgi:sulfofructose kinase
MPGQRVIVVGHAALDHVYRIDAFPAKPTKLRASEHIESGGGAAANAAAAIGKLGGAVELWSRVGEDDTGVKVRRDLESSGVDTRYVIEEPGRKTRTSAVVVDTHGERLIISEDDRSMPMSAEWLPLDRVATAGAVLSDLSWLEATRVLFSAARSCGVPTVVDLDVAGGRFASEILPLSDYAILSAPALDTLTEGADDAERLARIAVGGVRHAGVTRGAGGYTWLASDGSLSHQTSFAIDAVDTTGAGDAFHGIFTLALARGLADSECSRIASAAAALKCRRLGARAGLPTASELHAFLLERCGRGLPESWIS